MSYSEWKKIHLLIVLGTLTLFIFTTSFVKNASSNNNDLNNGINLEEINKQPIFEDSLEKTAMSEDTIIRSGKTMHIDGSYLYLIENYYNLEVYDLSDVNEPVLVEKYDALDIGYESKMVIQGDYIYIYSNYGHFYVLNRTNPLDITAVTSFTSLPSMINFAVNNWSLNILATETYSIYDFENFETPTLVGEYNKTTAEFTDLSIKGNYTYLIDTTRGFSVIDTSNESDLFPAHTQIVNESHYFYSHFMNETNLFIHDDTNDTLFIFDISSPTAPVVLADSDVFVGDIRFMYIYGSLIFMETFDVILIGDISDFNNIELLGKYSTSDYYTNFQTIQVYKGRYAILHNTYIAELQDRFPIFIFDISNPSSPRHIFPTANPYGFPDWLFPVLIAGGIAIFVVPLIIVFVIILVKSRQKTL